MNPASITPLWNGRVQPWEGPHTFLDTDVEDAYWAARFKRAKVTKAVADAGVNAGFDPRPLQEPAHIRCTPESVFGL